jgi:hypothetical protein
VSNPGVNEDRGERLWRIFLAWEPVHDRRPERVWQGDSPLLGASGIAVLVGLAAVPVLGYLDSALWSDTPGIGGASSSPSGTLVAWALIAGCLVQGGLVERFLARQTREEIRICAWLRCVRRLAAAVPLFGLYAVPGWRWLLDRRPGWAFAIERPGSGRRGALSRQALPNAWILWFEGTSRWLVSLRVLVSLYLFEMIALLLLALWLGSAGKWAGAWALSLLFHLIAFLGMAVFFTGQARRAMLSKTATLRLCSLSLAWLPSVPLLPLLGCLPFLLVNLERQERTLTHQAHAGRTATDNLPQWRRLKEVLNRQWERAPWWRRIPGPPRELIREPDNPGMVDAHLTALYSLRSLSLPLETAWMAWMSLRLAGDHVLRADVDRLSIAALILGLAGLLFVAAGFLRRLLHATAAPTPHDRHSSARAFAFTQLGCAAGLQIGEALHVRDPLAIATVAGAAGLLGMMVFFGPLLLEILRPVPDPFRMDIRQLVPWLLLCPLLLAASLRFSGTADLEREWRVLRALVEVAPLLGVFPGIAHLDWLLRPYTAKRMFSRELPLRLRATLAFLTFTGLLPLGGLAVPAWIASHRRGWPIHTPNGNENSGDRS